MGSDGPCRLLEWDSAFFGIRIGRVQPARLDRDTLARVLTWAHDERIDCLYLLVEGDDPGTLALAQRSGFRCVDVRTTLERSVVGPHVPGTGPDPDVTACTPEDVATLGGIARSSHRGTRFFADGNFPEERCQALYETWITRSCQGAAAAVLVARDAKRAVGYVSLHREAGGLGRIGLIAVAPGVERQGWGRRLVEASLRWLAASGSEQVEVVTQATNVAGLKTFQAAGFRHVSAQFWLHLWPRERGR